MRSEGRRACLPIGRAARLPLEERAARRVGNATVPVTVADNDMQRSGRREKRPPLCRRLVTVNRNTNHPFAQCLVSVSFGPQNDISIIT
ncbi:hypothetical protein TNCV_3663871 [Trichonephila clavipes]|nr:hypothetical protein TNCV_3663871 [Trichonephila clavipes]